MEESRQLSEARTIEVESEKAQRRVRDKCVGSEEASFETPSPPCSPPLCHPVAEGLLASIGWLALWRPSGGPLVLCLYGIYKCLDLNFFLQKVIQ